MSGPCDCGAEDCPRCHSQPTPVGRDEPDNDPPVEEFKFLNGRKVYPEDFICEGYRDTPY